MRLNQLEDISSAIIAVNISRWSSLIEKNYKSQHQPITQSQTFHFQQILERAIDFAFAVIEKNKKTKKWWTKSTWEFDKGAEAMKRRRRVVGETKVKVGCSGMGWRKRKIWRERGAVRPFSGRRENREDLVHGFTADLIVLLSLLARPPQANPPDFILFYY